MLCEIAGNPCPFRCPTSPCTVILRKTPWNPIGYLDRVPYPFVVHIWNPDTVHADPRRHRRTADRFAPAGLRTSRSTADVSWRSTGVWCGPAGGRHGIFCGFSVWRGDRWHCGWWGFRFRRGSVRYSCRNSEGCAGRLDSGWLSKSRWFQKYI